MVAIIEPKGCSLHTLSQKGAYEVNTIEVDPRPKRYLGHFTGIFASIYVSPKSVQYDEYYDINGMIF